MSADWFREQLISGVDTFAWAVAQVPSERRILPPPSPGGSW